MHVAELVSRSNPAQLCVKNAFLSLQVCVYGVLVIYVNLLLWSRNKLFSFVIHQKWLQFPFKWYQTAWNSFIMQFNYFLTITPKCYLHTCASCISSQMSCFARCENHYCCIIAAFLQQPFTVSQKTPRLVMLFCLLVECCCTHNFWNYDERKQRPEMCWSDYKIGLY